MVYSLLITLRLVMFSCSQGGTDPSPQNDKVEPQVFPSWNPGHYIFLGSSDRISDELLEAPGFRGIQVRYFWNDLEPEMDQYDFSLIRNDLRRVAENGKQLFIQLQWKSFTPGGTYAPEYIISNPEYVYYADGTDSDNPPVNPRLWDPFVQERFNKLIEEIGKSFDQYPYLEGINLPESAPSASVTELGRTGYYPLDENNQAYRDNTVAMHYLKSNMLAMKSAFPLSLKAQYMNFRATLFSEDNFHEVIKELGIGMGGPDVGFRDNLLTYVYPYYPPLSGSVPLCVAVQTANYDFGGVVQDVWDLYRLGRDTLKLNHLFWSVREPWWSDVKEMVVELTQEYGPARGLDSIPPLSVKAMFPSEYQY